MNRHERRKSKALGTSIRVRPGVAHLEDGRFKAVVRLDFGETSEVFESEPYDAEAVVRYCGEAFGPLEGRRIIYKDTAGVWDELEHDGAEFVRFGPIRTFDLGAALERVAESWQ